MHLISVLSPHPTKKAKEINLSHMRSFFPPICRLKSGFWGLGQWAASSLQEPNQFIQPHTSLLEHPLSYSCVLILVFSYYIKMGFILMTAFFGTLLKFCSQVSHSPHTRPWKSTSEGPPDLWLALSQDHQGSGWRPLAWVNFWELLLISPRDFLSF